MSALAQKLAALRGAQRALDSLGLRGVKLAFIFGAPRAFQPFSAAFDTFSAVRNQQKAEDEMRHFTAYPVSSMTQPLMREFAMGNSYSPMPSGGGGPAPVSSFDQSMPPVHHHRHRRHHHHAG